jgi:UDP-2-acetamido-3-amino-2,3-dideoxy-glucuronate N-acetyltransferase
MDQPSASALPRVAVVGSGYWGKNLVRNYYQLGALAWICDTDPEVLARFRQEYPGVRTSRELAEVLGSDESDAVVIATPAATHHRLAASALQAGKHVYVEKPLVLNESEGEELVDLARRGGLVLMVGHLLQYHPIFVRLKQMAGAGELGRINYIYSHRLNLGKIRREENILWSFAPHDISMILSLAGEEPDEVRATGGFYLQDFVADVTTTHLRFPSGMRAHIFVSWLHPFKEQKLVVVGERKMAVFDDTLPWEDKLLLYPHQIVTEGEVPVPVKAEAQRVEVAQTEPLRAECQHFLDCIAQGQRPITDGREGLAVLRVLNRSSMSLTSQEIREFSRRDPGALVRAHLGPAEPEPAEAPGYFVHPTAVVDEGVVIGGGAKIWHFSHVLKNSRIGPECNLGQNVVVGPEVSLGRGCKIQNNVSVYQGVTLEDHVFCGPSMVFTNVHNPRAAIRRMDELRPTLVRTGASLGANCTIVCGNTVGRYAFVGAGAVVTKDVPDHALVAGNPARLIGWICSCGVRLDEELACPACNRSYRRGETGLAEA